MMSFLRFLMTMFMLMAQHRLSHAWMPAATAPPNEQQQFLKKEAESFSSTMSDRRNVLATLMSGVVSAAILAPPSASIAAADDKTIYRSGKAPIVPGQKPPNKDDTKGTRKDPNFLRAISQCKSTCLNTPGPDGLAKSTPDCLSECQDICCTTYEQCTFAITPRE